MPEESDPRERYPTGRKHCSKCGRWRPLIDFNRTGRGLNAWCAACKRIDNRHRRGNSPRVYGKLTLEERRRRHRAANRNLTEAKRRQKRERELMGYYLRKERETGQLPARQRKLKEKLERRERLPVGPFTAWLRENLQQLGGTVQLANTCGLDESQVRRWLTEEHPTVDLASVDLVLTRTGLNHIWELYPGLYL